MIDQLAPVLLLLCAGLVIWHVYRRARLIDRYPLPGIILQKILSQYPHLSESQEGIKRAWKLSCLRERIAPHAPQHLPLLFALDTQLAIPDGFHYSLDSKARNTAADCAGHIGCGSGCGGAGCGADSGSGCSSCGGD